MTDLQWTRATKRRREAIGLRETVVLGSREYGIFHEPYTWGSAWKLRYRMVGEAGWSAPIWMSRRLSDLKRYVERVFTQP